MLWKNVGRLIAVAALIASSPALTEETSLAGTWAVASGESILMVVTLADEDGDGASDSAAVERPGTMSLGSGYIASNVAGPVASRSSKAVYPSGDSVIAIFAARRADDPDDVYLISRLSGDRISFVIPGYPFPALTLERSAGAKVSADWDASKAYRLDGQGGGDNGELAQLFVDDQAVRNGSFATIDWSVVAPQDEARRARVRQMLDADEVKTGADYYAAAFIFQHGGKTEDYLLAHALAVTAVAKGHDQAAWIAAATLDRYLQNIGRAQIYGTQFQTPPGEPTTQEEYDRGLVSDPMRAAVGVPVLADQEARRKMFEERARSREASK